MGCRGPAEQGGESLLPPALRGVLDPRFTDRVDATWRLPFFKIAVAQWLADLARDRFGDPNVTVVPNAVDPTLFHAPPRGKNPIPTIGMMYGTQWFKGTATGLEAFRRFATRHPEARLIVFGYEQEAPHLPLPPSTEFHFQPRQSLLRELYARCDAWLFASKSEGFGLPILEAMACRTPVIGTPAGAAPELLRSGGGYLVRQDDPQDMADAIERLWALSDAGWQAMSGTAHAIAAVNDWESATDQFEDALIRAGARPGVGVS